MFLERVCTNHARSIIRSKSDFINCYLSSSIMWDKVFKNGPSEICRRQSLKNMRRYYGLSKQPISLQIF